MDLHLAPEGTSHTFGLVTVRLVAVELAVVPGRVHAHSLYLPWRVGVSWQNVGRDESRWCCWMWWDVVQRSTCASGCIVCWRCGMCSGVAEDGREDGEKRAAEHERSRSVHGEMEIVPDDFGYGVEEVDSGSTHCVCKKVSEDFDRMPRRSRRRVGYRPGTRPRPVLLAS